MTASSLIRSLLWLFSIALTLFVAAMSVSPQAAAMNVTRWLTLLGLASTSNWFTVHSNHRVHFSADAATKSMSSPHCTGTCPHSPSLDVPDVVLFAVGALALALLLIWLMSRRSTARAA